MATTFSRGPDPEINKRPIGITFLSILNFFGGLVFLVGFAVITLQVFFGQSNAPTIPVSFSIQLLGFLSLWSAIGMWRGIQWGWRLAVFYYVFAVFRNACALTFLFAFPQLNNGQPIPELYYWKHSIRIPLNALIVLYLFKENVLEYFGIPVDSRGKEFKAIGFSALALAFAMFILSIAFFQEAIKSGDF